MNKAFIRVSVAQRHEAARILVAASKTRKTWEIAADLDMIQSYVYLARVYPRGRGQPCPGWAVLKILSWAL